MRVLLLLALAGASPAAFPPAAAQEPSDGAGDAGSELAPDAAPLDEATRARLSALVREAHDAIRAGDAERLRRSLDLGGLLDAALARAPHPRGRDPFWRWTWTSGFLAGLAEEARAAPAELVVRSLRQDGARGGWTLLSATVSAQDLDVYLAWRIEPRDGREQIVDYRDVDTGWRLSDYVAAGIAVDGAGLGFDRLQDALARGQELVLQGDLEGAAQILAGELAAWPALYVQPLEAGLVQGAIEETTAGLARAEAFASAYPDAALGRLFAAQALEALGRADEAQRELARYEEAIGGPDRLTLHLRGRLLRALGRTDEAVSALEQALALAPGDETLLVELAATLPRFAMQPLRERFLAAPDGRAGFEPLVVLLLDGELFDAAECLCRAEREVRPDDANAAYYLARLHLELEQPEDALREAREALALAPDEERDAFQRLFLEASLATGTALAGYEACPDARTAFRQLAPLLRGAGARDDWRALFERHAARAPEDAWIRLERALLALAEGEVERGLALLREGLRESADEALREAFRWHLVDASYEHRRAPDVWRETPPEDLSFAQLVEAAFEARDAPFLSELLATRRALFDPLQPFYRGLQSLLAGRHASAVRQLERAEEAVEREGRFVFLRDQALVRAHLRNAQPDAARRCARRSQARDGDAFLPMLAAVGAGEGGSALALLHRCVRQGYDPERLYDDPDVGALLRDAPAYEEFRAEHPPLLPRSE